MAEFKRKEGLTTAVKTFYGVGDGGFVLMSNVETFYFNTSKHSTLIPAVQTIWDSPLCRQVSSTPYSRS